MHFYGVVAVVIHHQSHLPSRRYRTFHRRTFALVAARLQLRLRC